MSPSSPPSADGAAAVGGRPASAGLALLVDDDDAVRSYCKLVLELHGWQVLAADCAEAALPSVEGCLDRVRLLVTDVVMPGMNGRELADRLWRARPDLKVLFLSGYHADGPLRDGVAADRFHFLGKPFAPSALMAKVWEVVEERA